MAIFVRADFREGDEDSNFSLFRVRRFSEWPEPLHWIALSVEILTKTLIHWIASPLFTGNPFFSLKIASSHPLPKIRLWNYYILNSPKFWTGNGTGTSKQEVSKQGVMTSAWRPGSQYDVAETRGADSVLASNCRAHFGLPSTRRGCSICVTVRLPVRPRGETMYWQANANTPLSVTPLLNVPWGNYYLKSQKYFPRIFGR